MNKKILSALLATTMVATLLSGCVEVEVTTETTKPDIPAVTEAVKEENQTPLEDDGKAVDSSYDDPFEEEVAVEGSVLNIYCWNDEFKTRLANHYPGYVEVDDTHGTIGDVSVVWNITPSEENAYQINLDSSLLVQADSTDDDKIDIFLVESDYALKYVNTDYTIPVVDLGLKLKNTDGQYKYTKDVVTDYNGVLKGVSWQVCPGVMICRRDVAKEVFGTDNPDELNEYFDDWEKFKGSAGRLKDAGYRVVCSVDDTFRVYSNNVSSKWVEDGKINIDSNIKAWVNDSKELFDNGMVGDADIWSEEWKAGMNRNENVFAYFGPAWFIDHNMGKEIDGSIANAGGYVAISGPQPFFWGGTWICGAAGTDNPKLVADIMKQMTCKKSVMMDIAQVDNDFVNNKSVMKSMAADSAYGDKVLGGQNALEFFRNNAKKIDCSYISAEDQICNELFQATMKDYFEDKLTYEEAVDAFAQSVIEKCPWLTY